MKTSEKKRHLRARLFFRQGGRCYLCRRVLIGGLAGTLDHIVPRSLGGGNRAINLALACLPCNRAKANMPLEDFMALKSVIYVTE